MKLLLLVVYLRYSTEVDTSDAKVNLSHKYVLQISVCAFGFDIPHGRDNIITQDLPLSPLLSPSKNLGLTVDSANGMSAESLEMFCRFMV